MDISSLDWQKSDGLLPALVQHAFDGRILMQGWVSPESLAQTLKTGRVTFWSRSRQAIWCKGETSGNYLEPVSLHADCDRDSVLILARPHGPTCHLGTDSCFGEARPALAFLAGLDRLIDERRQVSPEQSYTSRLLQGDTARLAQKVGEEGVETALAAVVEETPQLLDEAADLLYHLMVLLHKRNTNLEALVAHLQARR